MLRVGGVCSGCGVSAPRGGVCSGGVSASSGVSAPGVSAWGGSVVSQHTLRQTPAVNRITDTSKNITLATTSLWLVKTTNITQNFRLCFHFSWVNGWYGYTGRERLIRSHSLARFSFELSGNSN